MAGPPSGRPAGPGPVRGLPRVPPPPARHPGAREAPAPPARPASPRSPSRSRPAGPLVARRDPIAVREDLGRRPAGPRPGLPRRPAGRLRRFVARHGWRAYAIPLLTVATVLTLVDLVLPAGGSEPAPAAVVPGTAGEAPAGTAAPTSPPAPPAPAEGDAGPTDLPPATTAVTHVEQGTGTVTVVPGSSAVSGSGPLQRFVVEVEDGIGVDGAAFAAAVEATLGDPRSWGNGGRMSFQRVGEAEAAAGDYAFRVSLVSPGSMERYCPGVGTGGYTSCRYGERAVINLARWETAVPHYDGDIATYRQYVVNHEVGHALGNGHQDCPGPGQVAPVMQQQTLRLDGCVKNAWPHP
ncbi:hypothetical protein JOD57_001573 [Geodermatophilus bullaregiensis]|uniref:DUF3152 domain-containing protein n=1 Tax=Geodermatophilus bullaregiensis TaxID=1564160 RepID=UPI0027DE56C2|nr:DUF3152 domain-containing protein [Geodermatophilus bullaregiensis]MBM7805736.1 hypothetical protein [Geodermatophilus bullaregiensis]